MPSPAHQSRPVPPTERYRRAFPHKKAYTYRLSSLLPRPVANARGIETFTFRAHRTLSHICTVEAPPPAQGRPGGLGRLAQRPDWRRGGRSGSVQRPEQAGSRPVGHPRSTRLAEVVLHDRESLSHMRNSATAPLCRRCGPALASLAKQDRPVLHKCTTRYSRSSMTAV